jgi:hypothetical protein
MDGATELSDFRTNLRRRKRDSLFVGGVTNFIPGVLPKSVHFELIFLLWINKYVFLNGTITRNFIIWKSKSSAVTPGTRRKRYLSSGIFGASLVKNRLNGLVGNLKNFCTFVVVTCTNRYSLRRK